LANNKARKTFRIIALLACLLALGVAVLGAYVRLSHAGLGCPDWPGCYGHLIGVPESSQEIEYANTAYPQRAVETGKAWKEVIHRYFAGALGLLILSLAFLGLKNRNTANQPIALPLFLVVLVIFQALLGMWTVTLLLKPVIVMLHLLGGLAISSLLWWLVLITHPIAKNNENNICTTMRPMIAIGTLLLVGQIILGGWTSANYAALACPDFPTCQGQWWPETDFKEAFVFWRGLGINYEFGVLENPARTTIHFSHRLLAIVVATYWLVLLLRILLGVTTNSLRKAAGATLILLIAQITLGISTVVLHLPISIAVMHNGGSALLLLSAVTLIYLSRQHK
jgi:cytochrome c oxidase assembly protein subunit 15